MDPAGRTVGKVERRKEGRKEGGKKEGGAEIEKKSSVGFEPTVFGTPVTLYQLSYWTHWEHAVGTLPSDENANTSKHAYKPEVLIIMGV